MRRCSPQKYMYITVFLVSQGEGWEGAWATPDLLRRLIKNLRKGIYKVDHREAVLETTERLFSFTEICFYTRFCPVDNGGSDWRLFFLDFASTDSFI